MSCHPPSAMTVAPSCSLGLLPGRSFPRCARALTLVGAGTGLRNMQPPLWTYACLTCTWHAAGQHEDMPLPHRLGFLAWGECRKPYHSRLQLDVAQQAPRVQATNALGP